MEILTVPKGSRLPRSPGDVSSVARRLRPAWIAVDFHRQGHVFPAEEKPVLQSTSQFETLQTSGHQPGPTGLGTSRVFCPTR